MMRLVGETITPVVVQKPVFYIKGCKVTITRACNENERGYLPYPRKLHYGKLVKGERKAPTIKSCYQGYVVVDINLNNKAEEKRLKWFLNLEGLGGCQIEGMGKIQWLERKEVTPVKKTPREKKRVIRKGLGNYPKPLQTAIKAIILHDFVHTVKHESKIYQEVEIESSFIRYACKNHHLNGNDTTNNWLIPIIKKYDGLASFLNRRIPRREERRYDYQNGEIDCKKVAEEIARKQNNIFSLYNYIYYDKTFCRFYETIDYADNKLRKHLLLAVNLLINDFKKGKVKVENNKIILISSPTTEKEEETKKFLSGSKVLRCIYPSKKELVRPRVEQTSFQGSTVQSETAQKKTEKIDLRWNS